MPTVLPSALDRVSAQVLGFDATAYITDTKSTLHERLGFPATFNSGDYLAGNLAKPSKAKKKNNIPELLAFVGSVAGLGLLAFFGLKKKVKLPKGLMAKLPKFNKIKNIKSKVAKTFTDGFKKLFKKTSKGKTAAKKFSFKGAIKCATGFLGKIFKSKK